MTQMMFSRQVIFFCLHQSASTMDVLFSWSPLKQEDMNEYIVYNAACHIRVPQSAENSNGYMNPVK